MRKLLFADEAGDFTFATGTNISKYFILCTISVDSHEIGNGLLDLKHDLSWQDHCEDGHFHASSDKQHVRDHVFEYLQKQDFRIDATILEKSKAQPQTRLEESTVGSVNTRFYKTAWYYHIKNVAPTITSNNDIKELFVIAASIGTKRKRAAFREILNDVVQQSVKGIEWNTAFWPCSADPCLQIADYCCWAIQRKWENNDDRSYVLIKDKIHREYDLFGRGNRYYY